MTRKAVVLTVVWILGTGITARTSPEETRRPRPGLALGQLQAFWGASYAAPDGTPSPSSPPFVARRLAKARPDECYVGLGEPNVYPFDFEAEVCDFGRPKVNESYVFGLTRAGRDLWFGTAPNMGCLVYGSLAEAGIPGGLVPFDTALWTCEYGAGRYGARHGLPDAAADWRPPAIYVFDTAVDRALYS